MKSESESNVRSNFPKRSLTWTVLAVLIIVAVQWMARTLIEDNGFDPAFPWIVTYLLTMVTIVVWISWAFRISWLAGLAALAAPILFFTLFYIDFGGDGNLRALRPRFWDWRNANFEQPTGDRDTPAEVATTPYDFPQFLGPDRDLTVDQVQLANWDATPELLWKIDVGDAWSGFAVVGGLAYTQEQRNEDECITCYDVLTGKAVWVYRAKRRHEDAMAMGKVGPRATPTVDSGRVYAVGGTGVLDCLDAASGELIWSVDVPELVNIKQVPYTNSLGIDYSLEDSNLAWGRSCSPLIVGDQVIVAAGGSAQGENVDSTANSSEQWTTLLALDKATGKEIWSGGNRMPSYGSPNLATVGQQPMITLVTEQNAVGHDPQTGRELWSVPWPGQSNGAANCSQVTALGNGRFLLTKAYQQGTKLFQVNETDNGWTAETLKDDPRMLRTKFTNPIVIDGHAYALADAFLECVEISEEAPYLRRKWRQRGRFGNGQILGIGDKLLVHTEDGELCLVAADPEEYKLLGKIGTIDGFCWNTIALYGDLVLVRSNIEAACFRLPIVGDPIEETQTSTQAVDATPSDQDTNNDAADG